MRLSDVTTTIMATLVNGRFAPITVAAPRDIDIAAACAQAPIHRVPVSLLERKFFNFT